MQQSVPKQIKTAMQKTSDSFGNFCINETNLDSILEAILEQVPCI